MLIGSTGSAINDDRPYVGLQRGAVVILKESDGSTSVIVGTMGD
jgi:hypothetical protein